MDGSTEQERDVSSIGRRHFIRRMTTTLAAGLGLAVIPATAAWAPCSSCCRDDTCPNCPGPNQRYRCSPGNCCICHSPQGQCFGSQNCFCL
jgi:hypothetical protein